MQFLGGFDKYTSFSKWSQLTIQQIWDPQQVLTLNLPDNRVVEVKYHNHTKSPIEFGSVECHLNNEIDDKTTSIYSAKLNGRQDSNSSLFDFRAYKRLFNVY